MIDKSIQHYKILAKLGEGGMGVVYKAEDTKLKRSVALKFLPAQLTQNPQAKERFMIEAQTASALDHPNICTIHQIDETDDGQMFICMGYYEGQTLTELIREGVLPLERALDIAIQASQGLSKAHDSGIIHRDIKPANIMVTDDGLAKILDFGLAKLSGTTKITKTGTTLGTPAYMSPEQVKGQEAGPQTDVWALGVILYEMLTKQIPFKGDSEMSVMYAIVNTAPTPISELNPSVPPELEQIVQKAMQKKSSDRFTTMHEMTDALKQVQLKLLREADTHPVEPLDATKTIVIPPEDDITAPPKKPSKARQRHDKTVVAQNGKKSKFRPVTVLPFILLVLVGWGIAANLDKIKDFFSESNNSPVTEEPTKIGSIFVSSTPSGASILLDESDTGLKTPATIDSLPAGEYSIALKLPGHEAASRQMSVATGQVSEWRPDLKPTLGTLSIYSNPEGASISIDGENTGEATPATFEAVEPGSHQIELRMAGYAPVQKSVEVGENEANELSADLNPLRQTTTLTVNSKPRGAAIFLNGRKTGHTTPHTFSNLNPTEQSVRLVLSGHHEASKKIELAGGKDNLVTLDLKKKPPGKIRVIAVETTTGSERTAIADITIDGKAYGQTPTGFFELSDGSHSITARLFGHEAKTKNINVVRGMQETIKFVF